VKTGRLVARPTAASRPKRKCRDSTKAYLSIVVERLAHSYCMA
jgi:hypothetical protein